MSNIATMDRLAQDEITQFVKNRFWQIAVGLKACGITDENQIKNFLLNNGYGVIAGECVSKGWGAPERPDIYIENEVIPELRSLNTAKASDLIGFESLPSQPTLVPIESKSMPKVDEAVFHGLAGEYVRLIEPYSEADPVGILVNILTGFGNAAGNNSFFPIGAGGEVYPRIFSVLVGKSAKGRKGTTWSDSAPLFKVAATEWFKNRVSPKGGLSSGEGLLHAVRDPRYDLKEEVNSATGEKEYIEYLVDPGEDDKRLFIIESEFSTALSSSRREGNTLSEFIRNAYDIGKDETWSPLVKNNKDRATGAHISIIGHITDSELKSKLTSVDIANGFANRFLWFLVKRSKFIPIPHSREKLQTSIDQLGERLARAIGFANQPRMLEFDPVAIQLWEKIYVDLGQEESNSILDSLTSRSDSNTLRLAMIYALLDESEVINQHHILAAYALVDYAKRCTAYIFGESSGNPLADTILEALEEAPDGLSRTDIYNNVFNRNQKSPAIKAALDILIEQRKVQAFSVKGLGTRKKTIYKIVEGAK